MYFNAGSFCFVFTAFLQQSLAFHCSSEPKCRCFYDKRMVVAECSGLKLLHAPRFNESVQSIDLSTNRLSEIPADMPPNIISLNIAENKIIDPKKEVLSRYKHLRWLDIGRNCLWQRRKTWPSRFFENLKQLETLLMKDDCVAINVTDMKYSHECFYGLSSLRYIELNGLRAGNFGDAFDKNNSIQILVLSGQEYCYLQDIRTYTFNVFKKLTKLTLHKCFLTNIEKGAFAHMNNLVHLDISNNKNLHLSVLPNITYDLRNSKLQTLIADSLQCFGGLSLILTVKHIENLQNTSLKKFSLAGNRIAIIDKDIMKYLPKSLTNINIGDNMLQFGSYIFQGSFLPNLERLDVEYTGSYRPGFQIGCNTCSNSCCTKTAIVNVSNAIINDPPKPYFIIRLPPKLKILNIANQRISHTVLELGFFPQNSLTHLYAQGNFFYSIHHITGIKNLEYVNLSNNFCSSITNQSFQNMSSLLFLNLSTNLLGKELRSQNVNDMLHFPPHLRVLDLSYNWITTLALDLFAVSRDLESLNLSNNEIESVSFDLSSSLKLREIDLSFNKIVKLDSASMKNLDFPRKTRLSINLANNPLVCTCQSLGFLEWMKESLNKHFLDQDKYTCSFSNSTKTTLGDLDQVISTLKRECKSYTTLVVAVTVILLVTIVCFSLAIMYRYRWKLRYLYYAGKRSSKGYSKILEEGREYHFDAFISYAENERQILIPNLLKVEKENTFKFCIHSRDFMPGVDISENITNAIHFSRRTIVFLSEAFLGSEYCMYEIQMARMESISRGGENVLFIVLLDDHLRNIPNFLEDLLSEQSYLPYDKQIPEEFWNALTQVLKNN
ncbi:toll-like receptor 4 [Ostrea edulis]|uniref:toll-like receptor 4 n=1 Tax=Ostrea edulis TaxID=37623 RepID=UPI0024AFEF7A|nr:toll-like receptor 4 [Ostrea edulis]